jgi:hypothetical protein
MDTDTEQLSRFWRINGHQGPLCTSDAGYKGSTYNALVEWESGEILYKPLDMIGNDDLVTCAEYEYWMNLLGASGWKRFRHLYKNPNTVERIVNQAKLRSYRCEPFWKFGVMVPRTHNQAVEIDQANGNHLWQESQVTEMKKLAVYKTFINKGR